MSDTYCLVFCTCPDATVARQLGERLVSERAATCVNLVPGLTSIYPWNDAVETAEECLLIAKTEVALFGRVESLLSEHHPYELPEIVAIPLNQGSTAYLQWISAWLHPDAT